MSKANIYTASDYAGLIAKHFKANYGYEEVYCTDCRVFAKVGTDDYADHEGHETEWCFVAEFNGETIRIPSSKLKADDARDTGMCLLKGIAWLLEKYELRLPEEVNQKP